MPFSLLPLSVTVVPFFCACVVSLSCEYGCHALFLGFFTGLFLPSLSPCSVWSWCGCVFSRVLSFHFGYFWTPPPPYLFLGFSGFCSDLLFLFFLGFSCVHLLSGVLRKTYYSFVFMCEDILSAFEILSLVSPFLSLSGVEVWLVLFPFFVGAGSRAFCLQSFVLQAVDSSLGSGKFRSPVFVCDRSLLRFFSFVFYPLRVVRTELWSFFFSNKSSGGPQVVFFLGLGSGAVAPCGFRVWACGISLSVSSWRKTLFCLPFLHLWFDVFPAFSKTVAECGDFLVVSSTSLLPDWCVSMLLFFAAFFFFRCECLLGTSWYALFWSLAGFHSLYAALLLLLDTFVFRLSSFPFLPVLNKYDFVFFEWDWGCKGCCVSSLHVCPVRGVSFSYFPKVLVVLQGAIAASLWSTLFFSVVAAATLLTPRNCFWANFNSGGLFCDGAFLSCGVYNLHLQL